MRKAITLILLCFSVAAWSQQEEQFTQFMYYKMGFNPAYAGSNEAPCISILARNQWLGIEGAPETQLLTFNMPLFNQRVGIGATVSRHTIGLTERFTADGVYSYRIPVGRGYLRMGVQGSIRLIRSNFNKAESTQPIDTDVAIPVGIQSKYVPNFGAGIYYSSQRFFFGVSAPRLLQNNIDLADGGGVLSKEVSHLYVMGGILFKIGENVQLQPQLLLKYVKGAPFDGDANVNFIFSEKFTAGVSYRLGGSKKSGIGESVSLVFGAQITDDILFGVSYDYTLSGLRDYNTGSIEAMLRYCIGGSSKGDIYVNPRFF